jgi:4-hydroxy-tetrahydrodipicolinate synthase
VSAANLDPGFLRGSYVPLVTPFTPSGDVDEEVYASLVERQIAQRSAGVVVTGTSGEPSLLTMEERARLIEVAVKTAGGRVGVVAATGGQALPETLELTRRAERAGADAALVVTPYYVKPPQRGLVEYFTTVASSVGLPVLIYHIPGRAGVPMTVDSIAEVAEGVDNLVGVKHASNDLGFATDLLVRLGRDFRLFCGLEELSFPMLAIGAAGLMNAVGNIAPGRVAQLCAAVFAGELDQARELHFELFELNQAVFWDTNPIPIKYLMAKLGLLAGNNHRLPMSPAAAQLRQRLDDLLGRLNWLPE